MCTLSITLRDAQQGRRGIALNEIELYAQDGAKISPGEAPRSDHQITRAVARTLETISLPVT